MTDDDEVHDSITLYKYERARNLASACDINSLRTRIFFEKRDKARTGWTAESFLLPLAMTYHRRLVMHHHHKPID